MNLEVGKIYNTTDNNYTVKITNKAALGVWFDANLFTNNIFQESCIINSQTGIIYNGLMKPESFMVVDNESPPSLPKGKEIKCDCGGYKTYGTYDPEFHSDWCQVHKKQESNDDYWGSYGD